VKLEADSRVRFSRDRVWKTYLDDLENLVEFLPNVARIERKSREETGGVIRIVRLWTAKARLPDVAASIIKPHMLQWTDTANWDPKTYRCEWRIESGALPKALDCRGATIYEETSATASVVSLRGEIVVHPEHVPGVPRLFASTVRPLVERVIVAAIEPNLRGVAAGVEKYLEAQPA
jgi:hypothetical protein